VLVNAMGGTPASRIFQLDNETTPRRADPDGAGPKEYRGRAAALALEAGVPGDTWGGFPPPPMARGTCFRLNDETGWAAPGGPLLASKPLGPRRHHRYVRRFQDPLPRWTSSREGMERVWGAACPRDGPEFRALPPTPGRPFRRQLVLRRPPRVD